MGIITFNGITSESVGIVVERPPDYDVPERIYEMTPVPGRNGDVAMDTGAYKNSSRVYDIAIGAHNGNFSLLARKMTGWLHQAPGYLRLEDSYDNTVFMLAKCSETNSIVNILQQAGRATITFDRKPQRFLKTGAETTTITKSTVFTNPTSEIAKPLLKVYGTGNGNGTVTVGTNVMTLTGVTSYIFIDSEIEDCYKDTINMNNNVAMPDDFPVLKPGNTTISFTGNIIKIDVIPRWWLEIGRAHV